MTDSVGIVGSVQGVATPPVVAPPANVAVSVDASAPGLASTSTLVHSPRLVLDPAAGFITEYLSANGSQVVSQSPSAITVAYLRIGLTAQGLAKSTAQEPARVGTVA